MNAMAIEPLSGVAGLEQRLRASSYSPLRELQCRADTGRVILKGRVPCYYLRQVAESLAARCVGLEHLDSQIEVTADQLRHSFLRNE